jgi:FAD synthetase
MELPKMKTVMCFGSFDLLHPGHLYYLRESKKKGDRLIVVVARDAIIEKVKGKKPKYNERERLEHIRELPVVDKAVLGYIEDPYEIIEEINPDVVCLGYDQDSFSEGLPGMLKKRGMSPAIFRIDAFNEHIYKSSKLK